MIGHAGKTLALIEGGCRNYELTDELDTVGVCDFDGTLTGGYTAHPQRDPETGELHAVSYSMHRGNTVQYSVIDADGRARRTVDIEVGGSPMMHDFSLTERHVVFYDLPVTFDARQAAAMAVPRGLRLPARLMLSALIGRVRIPDPIAARQPRAKGCPTGGSPYSWNPKYPARVGVMPREGGNADVRWFDVEPCYVFHPMNAYDDGDTIVLDVVRHPKMFDTEHLGPNEGAPTLDRWTVDLADGKVRESRFDDRGQEFPRVDERLVGKRHRYGYAPAFGDGMTGTGDLLKHDFVGGNTQTRSFGAGKALGEFVFHPSSRRIRRGRWRADGLSSTTGPPIAASWRSSTRRPCRTSPASNCRIGCPPDFTATGCRAPADSAGAFEDASGLVDLVVCVPHHGGGPKSVRSQSCFAGRDAHPDRRLECALRGYRRIDAA